MMNRWLIIEYSGHVMQYVFWISYLIWWSDDVNNSFVMCRISSNYNEVWQSYTRWCWVEKLLGPMRQGFWQPKYILEILPKKTWIVKRKHPTTTTTNILVYPDKYWLFCYIQIIYEFTWILAVKSHLNILVTVT